MACALLRAAGALDGDLAIAPKLARKESFDEPKAKPIGVATPRPKRVKPEQTGHVAVAPFVDMPAPIVQQDYPRDQAAEGQALALRQLVVACAVEEPRKKVMLVRVPVVAAVFAAVDTAAGTSSPRAGAADDGVRPCGRSGPVAATDDATGGTDKRKAHSEVKQFASEAMARAAAI